MPVEQTDDAVNVNADSVAERLAAVEQRIRAAERRFQRRPGEVGLLAVSKTKPAAMIAAAAAAGQRRFGENYPQEALKKIAELAELNLEWHLIGPLQSNKTRAVAEHCAWVQSVDRLKIARRLSEQRPAEGRAAERVAAGQYRPRGQQKRLCPGRTRSGGGDGSRTAASQVARG